MIYLHQQVQFNFRKKVFIKFLKFIIPFFTLRVLFRRIYYSDRFRVPDDKPLILAGNHPNSFLDGIIVSAYLGRPVHYLVRGDMFGNKLKRWLLRNFNVSPIYRLEEGFTNVHKNEVTFKAVYRILQKNENLIIFGEGTSVPEKRLRPLRKGIARMAFEAEDLYSLDIQVVPVGINYTYPTRFREEVMVRFHDPISIREMMDLYKENKAKAYLAFNRLLEEALREEVIIIEDNKYDKLAEWLFTMNRNDNPPPFFMWKSVSDARLSREKIISDTINIKAEDDNPVLDELAIRVKEYFEKLESNNLNDRHLAGGSSYHWVRNAALLSGWPIFFFGYLSNILPYCIPDYFCKTKIRQPQFYMAVYMAIGTVLYLVWFPLIMALSIVFFSWWGLLSGLSVPIAGYLALFYLEIYKERLQFFHFSLIKRKNPEMINDLISQRTQIHKMLLKSGFPH